MHRMESTLVEICTILLQETILFIVNLQVHNNQIYNNTISKSRDGINVNSGSSNNKVFGNTIRDSINDAILMRTGSSGNSFTSNKILSTTPQGLTIVQDPTSKNKCDLQ
jgi:parallel beta-helix repeat protein